jgi:hypothetical protein
VKSHQAVAAEGVDATVYGEDELAPAAGNDTTGCVDPAGL